MVDIDVLPALNEYFGVLRSTCGTLNKGELRRLSVLPLLKDIVDGLLTPYVPESDAFYIDQYIKDCFSDLISPYPNPYSKVYLIYSGTSNSYPSNNVILNTSLKYASSETKVASPPATGKFFWVAMPKDFELTAVDNKNFKGDYIPLDYFQTFTTTIDALEYTVYYTKSVIPLNSTYIISLKHN